MNHDIENESIQSKIDQYLLGRMTQQERAEFEKQLAEDTSLQVLLQEQQVLASAVRSVGKAELKAEMQRQLASQTGSTDTVQLWLKMAAAVLVIAISIGGYYLLQQPFSQTVQSDIAQSAPEEVTASDFSDDEFRSGNGELENAVPPALMGEANQEADQADQLEKREMAPSASGIAAIEDQPPSNPTPSAATKTQDVDQLIAATVDQAEADLEESSMSREGFSNALGGVASQASGAGSLAIRQDMESLAELATYPWSGQHQFLDGDEMVIVEVAEPFNASNGDLRSRSSVRKERALELQEKSQVSRNSRLSGNSIEKSSDSFAVEVLEGEGNSLSLKWFVSPSELGGDPEKATINRLDKNRLKVRLETGVVYIIDLSQSKTRAIRQ